MLATSYFFTTRFAICQPRLYCLITSFWCFVITSIEATIRQRQSWAYRKSWGGFHDNRTAFHYCKMSTLFLFYFLFVFFLFDQLASRYDYLDDAFTNIRIRFIELRVRKQRCDRHKRVVWYRLRWCHYPSKHGRQGSHATVEPCKRYVSIHTTETQAIPDPGHIH